VPTGYARKGTGAPSPSTWASLRCQTLRLSGGFWGCLPGTAARMAPTPAKRPGQLEGAASSSQALARFVLLLGA